MDEYDKINADSPPLLSFLLLAQVRGQSTVQASPRAISREQVAINYDTEVWAWSLAQLYLIHPQKSTRHFQ